MFIKWRETPLPVTNVVTVLYLSRFPLLRCHKPSCDPESVCKPQEPTGPEERGDALKEPTGLCGHHDHSKRALILVTWERYILTRGPTSKESSLVSCSPHQVCLLPRIHSHTNFISSFFSLL